MKCISLRLSEAACKYIYILSTFFICRLFVTTKILFRSLPGVIVYARTCSLAFRAGCVEGAKYYEKKMEEETQREWVWVLVEAIFTINAQTLLSH